MAGNEIGYYTLPVILSMEGVEKQVSSKLSRAFGDVGKKAGKALADGSDEEVKKAIASYGKLRDKAQDALGKIRIEEEKLNKARAAGKPDQIIAAEERLAKARRDSNRINREAVTGYEKVDEAQKRLANSMSGSGGLFGKLRGAASSTASAGGEAAQGFLDGFGGPIGKLGTKAGPIGIALAGVAALGLAAGKVLADNVLAGMDKLQSQANVAAAIGISPEQMKPIAKAAGEAYAANFGDSIVDNMDAAKAAIQGGLIDPDATGAEVKKVVEQLTTVARVTGEDIPAAVRAASQAVRTGMAQDFTEAFDLIIRAQQTGLNAAGDIMDTVNEYSTQFRKLGLDGEEAFGLIAQAVQGGARDADVAADALKEFSIRSIDGSKATGEALQGLGLSWKGIHNAIAAGGPGAKAAFSQVVQAIQSVEDPAKRAQIQVALFGTQAEDLGGAINNMNLDTAAAQFDNVAGATQRAADTAGGTAASTWESAKRSIEVSIGSIQTALAEALGPALQDIADWVIANDDKIIDFFIGIGKAAITATEFTVKATGDIVSSVGKMIKPIGDAYGLLLKLRAKLADISGDDETAKQLNEEAEAAFGWGEGLEKAGDAMKSFDATNLHKALDDAGEKAKTATEDAKDLGIEVDGLDGKDAKISIDADTDPAKAKLEELRNQFFEAFKVPVPANLPAIGGGDLSGATAPSFTGASGTGATGSEKGLTQVSVAAKRAIEGAFPEITNIGGWRPQDGYNEHFSGQALDVMIPNWSSPGGKAYGDSVAKYMLSNASALGIDYILWQQRQWNADGTSSAMGDRGDPTQNHMDHIHAHTVKTPDLPGATAPRTPAPSTTSINIASAPGGTVPNVTNPDGTLPSVNLPAGNDALINAYGPGYKPGIGTPGRDEYGELGYYRVDPDKVQSALDSRDDREWSAQEAERRAQEAREARQALDDDPNADDTSIAGADESVRKAERAAAVARREAAKSAQDVAEAMKGDFTKARKEQKQAADKGQDDNGLAGIGGIFGSFLKETLGIDISGLMPLQMLGTALNVGGAMSQSLTEHNASAAPFGIPEIAAPPMPVGGAHGLTGGLPGPGTVVNVDNSQNFNNSPVGSDPAEVEKQRQNNINRSPRLPVGIG